MATPPQSIVVTADSDSEPPPPPRPQPHLAPRRTTVVATPPQTPTRPYPTIVIERFEPKKSFFAKLHERQLPIVLITSEILFIVLYGCLSRYDQRAMPDPTHADLLKNNVIMSTYPMFQDIHTMVFVGFGFLMTFLKRYAYSAVGFNLLLAAYSIQWAGLCEGFLQFIRSLDDAKVHMAIDTIVSSDFGAVAVLISFGAVLGKLSPTQYVLMTFFEVMFYACNRFILYDVFYVSDAGGCMTIHVFGAYFGLAVSFIHYSYASSHSWKEAASYFDDLFSMLGTIFLWIFWPSFNAAVQATIDPATAHRSVINTYIALAACAVIAFAVSSAVDANGKLNMVHIQNATVSGGVAVGCVSNFPITPVGAMIIGICAGIISVCGFKFLTPRLRERLHLHDTCGVHNLHGMPGIFGGIIGIIVALCLSTAAYGQSYRIAFARDHFTQAGFQTAGLAVTIAIGIFGGVVTGFILKMPCWQKLSEDEHFDDAVAWEVALTYERSRHPSEAEEDGENGVLRKRSPGTAASESPIPMTTLAEANRPIKIVE